MALFEPAVTKTLDHEGGMYIDRRTGEVSNHGISTRWLQSARIQYWLQPGMLETMTREQAAALYLRYFWEPFFLEQFHDQALADKTFDLIVNMGPTSAIRILQASINDLSTQKITTDGIMGGETIDALNALDSRPLLQAFRERAETHYRAIAAANPALSHDLDSWLQRLMSA